jgi:hypothetical protein
MNRVPEAIETFQGKTEVQSLPFFRKNKDYLLLSPTIIDLAADNRIFLQMPTLH